MQILYWQNLGGRKRGSWGGRPLEKLGKQDQGESKGPHCYKP